MTAATILIVEDDKPLQDSLHFYLTARNFRVLQAGTVDEAAVLLRKETPDLILLDLLLPGKRGTVLLESIKTKQKKIPIIVITNTDFAGRREECMQLGARDFIIKSNTSLQALVQLVVKYCDEAGEG